MLSLFSTSSDEAGFRLQYMEVYNWGTFHNKVFKITPQGNNSLLTGANGSGKSTFIDALLTLLVPVKKDRFYNQSSGAEKKGNRTEETYVLGNYGNIQREGELSTSTQALRNKDTYSVILASFANTDLKIVTLFQVRWFFNGEMKRAFGVAHVPLEIEKDFSLFDAKGNWKKKMEKTYNSNSTKKKIEFLDGPSSYAERIWRLFGMRSIKALTLFNQIVGVKVLEDLDEFIRTNMLEELDAEAEFRQLKGSFETLMDAKTNIEKAKEQIAQLEPIHEIADQLGNIETELKSLEESRDMAVYWFAQKGVELAREELIKSAYQLSELNQELEKLKEVEEDLKEEERTLAISIGKDIVGSKIKDIEKEIRELQKHRDSRKKRLDDYNKIALRVNFATDPEEETFKTNKEQARQEKLTCEHKRNDYDENLRQEKNKEDGIKQTIEYHIETIQTLQKNKNNISGREAEIRDEILNHIGATKEEIPFIGELIKVREEEKEWELSIEKILHNVALRLIVPNKYYAKVNEYVNKTNLKGRITYQRYQSSASLANMMSSNIPSNALVNKISFKPQSLYAEWLEDTITNHYDYACVKNLDEFNRYNEKAVTKEGLIKFSKGKHEKDDRPHISHRENFVLGWDNKDKIKLIQSELKTLQEEQRNIVQSIRSIEKLIYAIDNRKEDFSNLLNSYTRYDDIDWKSYAKEIQEKEEAKIELEKTNDKVRTLQKQLTDVKTKLKSLAETNMKNKNREIFQCEQQIKNIEDDFEEYDKVIKITGIIDVSMFEQLNTDLSHVHYTNLKEKQVDFQNKIAKRVSVLKSTKDDKEKRVVGLISQFKNPPQELVEKYKDWRSDVNSLPKPEELEYIGEYKKRYTDLIEDGLPKFEKKFNDYLQETITNKVGDFRMFFENWSDTIKENIRLLNDSLKGIDYEDRGNRTYIQLVSPSKINDEMKEFRNLLRNAIPNFREIDSTIDGKKNHFYNHIEPLISKLEKEEWRKKVMDVRSWFSYKAEEFYRETNGKAKTYENMGQLSGGEKAQLTYTILGSAIAYQFGLTKDGLQSNSFRFIAIDEAFKSQDEDKARYLVRLCKQLHLQLLVATPSDNIHIVEKDISFVHFVERKEEKHSWLYDMPIEQFREQRTKFLAND
jgi:uncharacterized protein YPO0396